MIPEIALAAGPWAVPMGVVLIGLLAYFLIKHTILRFWPHLW